MGSARSALSRALVAGVLALLALPAGAVAQAPPVPQSGCDPIDPAACMLPFPNDYFTVADPSTDTGRRIEFQALAMPRNEAGKAIDPTDYNRADGFSPGQLIVTKVPGLDTPEAFRRTGSVPLTDIGSYAERDQPVVVLDADTGQRHPIWTEIDRGEDLERNPPEPEDTTLLIRPAVNFAEGHRYIVALRDLKDADGRPIAAQPAFRALRDGRAGGERRAHYDRAIFPPLKRAGMKRKDLYLAWDFTVASERSISERMLSIRDRAFAELGDTSLADLQVQGASPHFIVDSVTEREELGDGRLFRRVEGRVLVPCFLSAPGCPSGSQFAFAGARDNTPEAIPGNTYAARFICNIPAGAAEGAAFRPSLYGHGLFGAADQVNTGKLYDLGADGLMFCGADWIGMSEEDIPNAFSTLADLSRVNTIFDRVQQGMLDFLYIGRAMIHPQGFSSHPAFQVNGRPVIDTQRLFYNGGSQGGIIGGSLTAVAPDFTRSVLIVGAMNYSLLLTRSIDFDPFASLLYPTYPNELERPLIISMIQLLWDRGEPNGYAWHMTRDPYPNTPRHKVLQILSFGDHQVANVATEVEARTIGSRLRLPAVDPGRHTDDVPYFGIRPIRRFPFDGNALVVWDIGPLRPPGCGQPGAPECLGTPPPPITNTAPRVGVDPHDLVIESEARVRRQIAEFLRTDGRVIDVCGAFPCHAAGWTGP
jgi:hypothetical protein